jgi:2OG-Fe(II) oxygenase superfamily
MIDKIYEFDNFLTEEEYNSVCGSFDSYFWKFTGIGASQSGRRFWYKDLSNSYVIKEIFRKKVESFLQKEIQMTQLYGNGQAHGQSAWVHQDVEENAEGDWGSLVYYLHRDWYPHLGGHLIFIEGIKVIKSIFPATNSAVLFNSKLNHCALEPTVYCTDQRVSIAYKFKIL